MFRFWLILSGLLLLAFNARITATAIGPVLPELAVDLGMSPSWQGLLTTLPVLWFAVGAAIAPRIMRLIGLRWTGFATMAAALLGQAVRLATSTPLAFLGASSVSLVGLGVGNILLPSLVKRYFGDRLALVTAAYSTAMSLGILATSVFTAPLSMAHGWVAGLGVWLIPVGLALPVWLLIAARPGTGMHGPVARVGPRISVSQVAGTRIGQVLAVFFGMQSANAYGVLGWLPSIYQAAGFSAVQAGQLMGLYSALGLLISFVVPALAGRLGFSMMVFAGVGGVSGFAGLLVAPTFVPWLWAALLAVGNGSFPYFLYLVGTRAESPSGVASLSGFTQSIGYLIALPGPLLVGVLLQFSGGWTVPLLFLEALMILATIFGLLASRLGTLEAELKS